jgi:predicted negative regulator of RcsB-dependent stress response
VDENLTDSERIERLRQFWRENGWFMIGGLAVGALLVFGWTQYSAYKERRAEGASALYQTLKQAIDSKDLPQATTTLTRMRSEFSSSAYTSQAGLLVAGTLVVSAPERASEELKYVMEHTNDPELAMVTRMRLARVLEYREQYDEALKTLAVAKPGKFAGRINEVKGDIVHHTIYSALNPNLVGTTQQRLAILDGDDLTLATVPDAKGNSFRIRWRRANRMP